MSIKCTEIIFTIASPLTVKLSGGTSTIIPHKINKEIVSLEMPNNYDISLGDCLKVKERPYKINIINKKKYNRTTIYELKTAERNKSSLFIFPMLGGSRRLFMYKRQFVNAFIKDNKSDENYIILLYRYSTDPLFYKFERTLEQFKDFITSYNPDPYHTVFVFNIPETHIENFKKFKTGKYSEMDDLYKLKILDFHGMDIDDLLGQILFKAEERKIFLENKLDTKLEKNSELLIIIDIEDETLNPEYYFKCNEYEKEEI